MFEKFSESE